MSKRFAIVPATGVFVVWVLMTVASPVLASDGWSMSSLNPFKKASTDNRARASYSDESVKPAGSSWLTQSRPSAASYAAKKKKEPSMFEKMSQGTSSFFGKTKDVLMPWSKSSKKPSSSKSHKPAKKSFFSSWFPEKKQQKEPKTVKDFLAQDRPS